MVNDGKSKRTNNIILNVKESALINKTEREKDEVDTVKKLFNEGDLNLENFKAYHIGKFDENKNRPVKVIFNNSDEPIEKTKKKRFIFNKILSIKVFKDQIPMQREYSKKKYRINFRKQLLRETSTRPLSISTIFLHL